MPQISPTLAEDRTGSTQRLARKHASGSWAWNKLRGAIQRHGPAFLKRILWDSEFSAGKWDYLDETGPEDSCIFEQIERFANRGRVLDLGCGPGTTGLKLDPKTYSEYVGVDISDVAIEKASTRSRDAGRSGRNQYCRSDIFSFEPTGSFDTILFSESIYYVPSRRILSMLNRYSQYLRPDGVFVARLCDVRSERNQDILNTIEENFAVVAKHVSESDFSCVISFRNRCVSRGAAA